MATNAEAIVSSLRDAGVKRIFGLPGGEVTILIEAIRKAGIEFYLTGHEASAAFMADVTGQLTARPGVCIATVGPGALNLALGVGNALLDRSPVIAITADISTEIAPHFPHQRIPLTQFFAPISKAALSIATTSAYDAVRQAIEVATAPPMGPVHIGVPSNLAGVEVSAPSMRESPLRLLGTSGMDVHEAAAIIATAKRPILVTGVGCLRRDTIALRRLADHMSIAFVTTPKGKGLLSEENPRFLGVVGGMALDQAVMENLDEADLLIGVGFDPVECDRDWYVRRPIVNFSRVPTHEGLYRPHEVLGEIYHGLEYLLSTTSPRPWPPEVLKRCRDRMRPKSMTDSEGVSPLDAIHILRDVSPRETILASDVGSHKYFAGQFWESYEPNTFLVSNGLSAMGYGIPAAIAAKLELRKPPVIALVGDAGLMMMLHNLPLIVRHRVPIVIVVFIDSLLSLIEVSQRRRGFARFGVEFDVPYLPELARAFGISGHLVRSTRQFRDALAAAIESGAPEIIAVPVSTCEYEAYC